MRVAKRVDKATRRRRQQWRDSKRRARARERAYKAAQRAEAARVAAAPAEVFLDGRDLTHEVHEVSVEVRDDSVDATMGGLFGDEPDQWQRSVPGLRSARVTLDLFTDDLSGWRNLLFSGDPKPLRVERLGRLLFEGEARVLEVTRHVSGSGLLASATVVLDVMSKEDRISHRRKRKRCRRRIE
jgi:hypothetical protein